MKIQTKKRAAYLLVASVIPLQAYAGNVAWTGDIDSNWTETGNWSTNAVPGTTNSDNADLVGSSDNAVINTSLLSYQLNQLRVSDGASLIINEPVSINNAMQLGAVASSAGGTIVQHDDTSIAAALRIGHLTTITTPSSYTVDDGELTVGTQIFIRNGSFEVETANPEISAYNMRVYTAGELVFDLGTQGVSPINLSSDFRIDSGANLVIDLSNYTQGAGTIELVSFDSIMGTFDEENVSIIGLEGGTLNYNSNSLTLTINEYGSIADPTVKGLWDFDNISGDTVNDSSGHNNDATLSGATAVTDTEAFKSTSLDFDGVNDTVSLPSSAFDDITDEVTIAMWVKGDNQARNDTVFWAEDASGQRVLNIHLPWSNSKVYWDAGNSGGSSYDRASKTAATSTFEGEWNHWVFVKNANTGIMSIYVNGELFHSVTNKTKTMSGIVSGNIGSATNSSYYDGTIDNVTLYNVALSAADVSALYEKDDDGGSEPIDPIGYQNEAWFALSAQACLGDDEDLVINNGTAISDLSSNNMACSQSISGDDMVYTIVWQGSDFDRDGDNDTLTFDVLVEGFTGSSYSYSATAGQSSMTSLGGSSQVTSDVSNSFWDVADDGVAGLGAGQSLRFSIENVNISANGYEATINGFNFVKLVETGGSTHTHIRGTGTGLDSSSFNHHENGASSYSFIAHEEFVITGAGDAFSHLLGSVNQIQFSLSITNPSLDTPFDDYDFARYGMGPDIVGLYPKADASREAYYPTFSWDNVPRWLAIRNTEAYTEEQIETIANHYDLVLLEKANSAGLANNDEGIKETSRRLKELNPDIKNIFYWNSVIFYSGYSNDAEYNVNETLWSDLDADGNVELFKGLYPTYNSEVAGLRDWWVELPTTIVTDENIDGVFVDKITEAQFDDLYDSNGEPVNGYVDMLKQLHEEMPNDKILIGNVLRGERNNGNRAPMEFFDGSYLERWDFEGDIQLPEQTKADAIAMSIQLMREALAQGKFINFQTNPHTDEAIPDSLEDKLDFMARHVEFPLAIFLMAAEKNAFFSYQMSVNARPASNEAWDSSHIDELNRPLGAPLGGPVKNGYIYTRSFEYVDVWLNLETEEATFTWRNTN
jgi:hypothetical protein